MKICFVGGAKSIHVQRWAKWFADRGHEVHLISPNYENIEGVKIHKIGEREGSITNFIRKMFQTRKLVWEIKPDILHAHYVFGYGTFAAFANYHPFVVSVYGSDVLREAKEAKIKRLMIDYVLRRADVIVPTAKFMKNYLHEEFGLSKDKIIRIPWGIDLKIFHRGYEKEVEKLRKKLSIDKDTFVVLSTKSMFPQWNIANILEAIPYVTKKYQNVVFVFIRGFGKVDYEESLKISAKKMKINEKVRFISRSISPKEMAVFLNMSNVFVWIPKTDQFANSIMEGMICGAIPIVSNIEVYRQYLENKKNAFFVNPDDPKDIAEKIIYCIEHPELRDKIYKINKKIIEENEDWDKNTKKMEELYKGLLEENN